jgi:hypothetical protein
LKNKAFLFDPSLYALLAMNGYMIYHYQQFPDSIHTIIPLYWVQSVMLGLFNFFDILTLQKTVEGSFTVNDEKTNSKGCAAFFFLCHYGFFHLAYLIFLAFKGVDIDKLDMKFLVIGFWIIVASQVITFIQHKIRYSQVPANIGQMFFLPYFRIIPMHFMIIIPAFLDISSYMVFLVLKTVFDLIMYVVSTRMMYREV